MIALSSVLAGSAAVRTLHVALEAPAVDHLGVETPVGADPEARQLSAPEQLVDGRWMHTQVLRQFLNRHHTRQTIFRFTSHDFSR